LGKPGQRSIETSTLCEELNHDNAVAADVARNPPESIDSTSSDAEHEKKMEVEMSTVAESLTVDTVRSGVEG
jgi:hypothetical protein